VSNLLVLVKITATAVVPISERSGAAAVLHNRLICLEESAF